MLAVRVRLDGDNEIVRVDASDRDPDALRHAAVVARVRWPQVAYSPSRLTDGRVVYVRFHMRDPFARGTLVIVDPDGTSHDTAITGITDAVVVGDRVVYEAPGADDISDLIVTDLVHTPVNLTLTPDASEHLGWRYEL